MRRGAARARTQHHLRAARVGRLARRALLGAGNRAGGGGDGVRAPAHERAQQQRLGAAQRDRACSRGRQARAAAQNWEGSGAQQGTTSTGSTLWLDP
jgi:hypothetical protein